MLLYLVRVCTWSFSISLIYILITWKEKNLLCLEKKMVRWLKDWGVTFLEVVPMVRWLKDLYMIFFYFFEVVPITCKGLEVDAENISIPASNAQAKEVDELYRIRRFHLVALTILVDLIFLFGIFANTRELLSLAWFLVL